MQNVCNGRFQLDFVMIGACLVVFFFVVQFVVVKHLCIDCAIDVFKSTCSQM